MKGNEARVVFFLQPVDQFKDGEVAKVGKPFWSYFGLRSLLLLGLILGLGVFAYVMVQIDHEPLVSTTPAPITSATTSTTVKTTSTPTAVDNNTTTTSPSPTIPPGDQKQTKKAHNTFHMQSSF